jgi:hypothetical protein
MPQKIINIPRNIATIFVRQLEILEQTPCANSSVFVFYFLFTGKDSSGYKQLFSGVSPRKKKVFFEKRVKMLENRWRHVITEL